MSAMSDYLENKLIDHIFRATSYSAPATLYIGLLTAAPSDTGGGTEVTGGSYGRASVTPSVSSFKSTNGTTSGASSGTGGQTSNASTITFTTPTAGWGTVTHFGIYDASSAGNLLFWGSLGTSKTINSGDTVSIAVDQLTVTFA